MNSRAVAMYWHSSTDTEWESLQSLAQLLSQRAINILLMPVNASKNSLLFQHRERHREWIARSALLLSKLCWVVVYLHRVPWLPVTHIRDFKRRRLRGRLRRSRQKKGPTAYCGKTTRLPYPAVRKSSKVARVTLSLRDIRSPLLRQPGGMLHGRCSRPSKVTA